MERTLRFRCLINPADGGPGVYADAGCEFLEAEPGAGLIGADLEGHAFTQNVDGQLEIPEQWRTERQRLLGLRGAGGIGEAGERQVPCPFDEHCQIAE